MTPEAITMNIIGLLFIGAILWLAFGAEVKRVRHQNRLLRADNDAAFKREILMRREAERAEERLADAERELAEERAAAEDHAKLADEFADESIAVCELLGIDMTDDYDMVEDARRIIEDLRARAGAS